MEWDIFFKKVKNLYYKMAIHCIIEFMNHNYPIQAKQKRYQKNKHLMKKSVSMGEEIMLRDMKRNIRQPYWHKEDWEIEKRRKIKRINMRKTMIKDQSRKKHLNRIKRNLITQETIKKQRRRRNLRQIYKFHAKMKAWSKKFEDGLRKQF